MVIFHRLNTAHYTGFVRIAHPYGQGDVEKYTPNNFAIWEAWGQSKLLTCWPFTSTLDPTVAGVFWVTVRVVPSSIRMVIS